MINSKKELNTWRFLTHFWGILTAIFFLLHFLHVVDLSQVTKSLSVIYIGILSLFATTKEFSRWQDRTFLSNHNGEVFVLIWTVLMLGFIIFNIFNSSQYIIPAEFTATYLGVLGIFAISRKSRSIKTIKTKKKK